MPRKKLIRTNHFPYHITSRSNNKEWFQLPLDEVWKIALDSLVYANKNVAIKFHLFVLMNNHYHMLISTPDSNIDQFMRYFNKRFTDKLKDRTNFINRMFGGPYKWSLITHKKYLYNVYRYIIQNPLRAEIVKQVNDYPYSSFFYQINNFDFPLETENIIPIKDSKLINWFNQKINTNDNDCIQRALCHTYFEPKKHRDSKYISQFHLPHFVVHPQKNGVP